MAGEVFRVKNTSDQPWVGRYANQRYVVPAGGEAIVPRGAVALWMGDPEAKDVGQHKARREENKRLLIKWGANGESRPPLEVWGLDGDRVITVLDDPDGRHLHEQAPTVAERDLLEEQLEKLRREQAAMQARIIAVEAGDQPQAQVPEDSASKVRVGSKTGK